MKCLQKKKENYRERGKREVKHLISRIFPKEKEVHSLRFHVQAILINLMHQF